MSAAKQLSTNMNKYNKQSATVNDVGRLWKSTQHSYRQFTDSTTPFSRNFPGQKYQVPRFSRNRCIFPDFSSAIFPRLTVSRHCKQHLPTHVTGTYCYWVSCTNKRPNLTWLTTLLKCLDVPTKVGLLLVNRHNWRAPWKNRISSTTMKLRKSLVKPVMRPNISSCLVLPPEIVMYDAFNERPPIYALSCMTIPGGRTEQLDIIAGFLPCHWLYKWFSSGENVHWYMRCAW